MAHMQQLLIPMRYAQPWMVHWQQHATASCMVPADLFNLNK